MSESSDTTENKADAKEKGTDAKKNEKDYTDEYVREIRTENHNLRLKIADIEKVKNEELTQKDNDYKKTLEEKINEVSSSYKKEIILSKLETEALRLGIIDPEIIKILDISKISMDEKNNITGLKESVEEFKKAKPHLFRKNESSSYDKGMPNKKEDAEEVDAMKMTPEQVEKYRMKLASS